jgi:hypothetical protein
VAGRDDPSIVPAFTFVHEVKAQPVSGVDGACGNLVKGARRNDNSERFGVDAVRATEPTQSKN